MTDRKKELLDIAKKARQMIGETRSNGTVNEYILSIYKKQTGAITFRTFKGWKDAGFSVKKGEKGYPVFSRPIGVIKSEKNKEADSEDFKRFGTAYLFNEFQINKHETA